MDGSTLRAVPPGLSSDWALFLDVDGCLLEHTDTPGQAVAPPELGPRLQAIAAELDGALALVSGRSIQMLDTLFPDVRDLHLAGLHGLERRGNQGSILAPTPPDALHVLTCEAQELMAGYPGALAEQHGPCLNLHWRIAPQAAPAVSEFATAALLRLPGYRLHPGEHGIEIRPDSMDKGMAIDALLKESPFRGRKPVFAGDDIADESGFAVVNERGGISVLVGPREDSLARYHLPDPVAVRKWLGVPDSTNKTPSQGIAA